MSARSSMSLQRPSTSSLPDALVKALEMRDISSVCPPEVSRMLASLPYFSMKPGKPTTRFTHLAGAKPTVSGWNEPGTHAQGDGFEVWSGKRRNGRASGFGGGGGGGGGGHGSHGAHGGAGHGHHNGPSHGPHSNTYNHRPPTLVPTTLRDASKPAEESSEPVNAFASSEPKFSSAAMKATSSTEDRILAKVKGKINKIGFSTYDATKTFMQQILDSDETEFLDEFMNFVFQKAATESTFCPLYAKLLHELADEFTHLRTVIVSRFKEYTSIFTEVPADAAPDATTESYREFVEAQERKKYRRGYSQFVAEMVKLGEVDKDAFAGLVQQIVSVLEATYTDTTKTLLCEEYIDCLANMCTSASSILSKADWSNSVKARLTAITTKSRTEVPGLTSKARFALMDLVDSANRGWK